MRILNDESILVFLSLLKKNSFESPKKYFELCSFNDHPFGLVVVS